jgi:uncharacterized protein
VRVKCGLGARGFDHTVCEGFLRNFSGRLGSNEEAIMKELIEAIAKALVDNPDQVQIRAVEGEQVTVLELRVHPSDLGKVIGKQGRTARSIRTILGAAGMKLKKRFTLEILE